MKKIITALLGALGANSSDKAQAPAQVVDVPADSILFSMPTIAMDDIEFDIPTASTAEGAPQFHEDDWRQLEFFPKTRLVEVQAALKELKSFEATHRAQHGWTQIYVREIAGSAVGVSAADIEHELDASTRPAPILTSSSHPLGQVKRGFSLELGKNAYLYGVQQREQITVLGASLQGADNMLLTTAFSTLNQKFGLILVDWAQQFVLVGIDSRGQFEAWRP